MNWRVEKPKYAEPDGVACGRASLDGNSQVRKSARCEGGILVEGFSLDSYRFTAHSSHSPLACMHPLDGDLVWGDYVRMDGIPAKYVYRCQRRRGKAVVFVLFEERWLVGGSVCRERQPSSWSPFSIFKKNSNFPNQDRHICQPK